MSITYLLPSRDQLIQIPCDCHIHLMEFSTSHKYITFIMYLNISLALPVIYYFFVPQNLAVSVLTQINNQTSQG